MSLKFVPEVTGCYYEDLTYFLHDNGQEACVMPANRIRHHAGSLNVKTGTDKADAALIADFGLERSMPAWQLISLNYKELRDLCRELSSVKKDLVRAKCQLHAHGTLVSQECPCDGTQDRTD
ncbi:Transposase [Bacteroidales bacterium Barb6XT]|nr:Transposase [Bacteroidales bacterium Barb6XT]